AVVADKQRRYREAQALYSEAIRLHGPDAELFNNLGYSFYLQGNLRKAEAAMLKAVALQPANPRFRNNLGMVYGHQGRHDLAMEQFRRAGSDADAYYNLAFVLASQDNVEGAKECFRRALAVDPAHERAGRALAAFQRSEQIPLDQLAQAPAGANGAQWIP